MGRKNVGKEWTCEVCSKIYKTKKYFDRHVLSHGALDGSEARQEPECPVSPPHDSNGGSCSVPQQGERDQLPSGYEWEEWCEDRVNEASTYFELEEEEEELRRTGGDASAKPQSQKPKKKKETALLKCPECPSTFNAIDTYIRHRAGHGMKAAFLKVPDVTAIAEACPTFALPILEAMESSKLTGGVAPRLAVIACKLKHELHSGPMIRFFSLVCDALCSEFIKEKGFLSPSMVAVSFQKKTSKFLSNVEERKLLHEILCEVTVLEITLMDSQMFLPYFLRKLSSAVLVFILRAIRVGDGLANVSNIHDRYAVTSQSTESTDFVQNMHYIGGSNIKSVLRTAMKYRTPEWNRVVITLRQRFIASEFSSAPPIELSAWTECRDRGGLIKISDNSLQFFVTLGKSVKPLERLDGSLLNSDVFDSIATSVDLLCLWDELKGNLEENESCKLLHAIVYHFCYTWRNGVLGRRHDNMAMSKTQKHGTGGLSLRARLGGSSGTH